MRLKTLTLATITAIALIIGSTKTLSEAPTSPAQPRKTRTSTTTAPAPTTTTTTVAPINIPADAYCPEWWPLAVQVGWPLEELEMLDFIIWRESRCQPDAWNGHDAGLTQINQIHTEFVAVMGWSWPEDLFNPEPALRFTLKLWQGKGWQPWGY